MCFKGNLNNQSLSQNNYAHCYGLTQLNHQQQRASSVGISVKLPTSLSFLLVLLQEADLYNTSQQHKSGDSKNRATGQQATGITSKQDTHRREFIKQRSYHKGIQRQHYKGYYKHENPKIYSQVRTSILQKIQKC